MSCYPAAHAQRSLLCWCTAASALGHLHSPHIESRRHFFFPTNAHFPTCTLQQTPFLGTKVPFPLECHVISGIPSKFPPKGKDSQICLSTREGCSGVILSRSRDQNSFKMVVVIIHAGSLLLVDRICYPTLQQSAALQSQPSTKCKLRHDATHYSTYIPYVYIYIYIHTYINLYIYVYVYIYIYKFM